MRVSICGLAPTSKGLQGCRSQKIQCVGRAFGLLALMLSVVGTIACDGGEPLSGESGQALYEAPHGDGNTFACASCHALREPTDDGLVRPGHPIGDAAGRPSFKNGQLESLREAVNVCRTEWMGATEWDSSDPDWQALEAFLEAQNAGAVSDALQIERVDPPEDLDGGDAEQGATEFATHCGVCHGPEAMGTQRAPQIAGTQLEATSIARRVRTSGRADSAVYEGLTGGRMPFWAADRLSDDALRHIVAFLEVSEATPQNAPDPSDTDGTQDRFCPSTHAKVGQVAELSDIFHGVGGSVRIVNDCTLALDNFNYDGGGIDVRVYGGLGGDYTNGFAIGPNLLRSGGYQNATLQVQLPENQTLDDLDGVSIWCVDVAVSFGDGLFAAQP